MLAPVALAAFILLVALIVVGAAFELRAEVAVARRDKADLLEWAWIALPILFLGVLIVLAGQRGIW